MRELLSPEGLRDPYVIYARFRRAEATGHDLGAVVVGYEAVIAALGDRRLSSDRAAGILQPLGVDVRGRCPMVERTLRSIVAFRDPPAHTRVRALMASAFGPRTVKRVADTIGSVSAARKAIKHVIVLVQENRSMDHYFGTTGRGIEGIPAGGMVHWQTTF